VRTGSTPAGASASELERAMDSPWDEKTHEAMRRDRGADDHSGPSK